MTNDVHNHEHDQWGHVQGGDIRPGESKIRARELVESLASGARCRAGVGNGGEDSGYLLAVVGLAFAEAVLTNLSLGVPISEKSNISSPPPSDPSALMTPLGRPLPLPTVEPHSFDSILTAGLLQLTGVFPLSLGLPTSKRGRKR